MPAHDPVNFWLANDWYGSWHRYYIARRSHIWLSNMGYCLAKFAVSAAARCCGCHCHVAIVVVVAAVVSVGCQFCQVGWQAYKRTNLANWQMLLCKINAAIACTAYKIRSGQEQPQGSGHIAVCSTTCAKFMFHTPLITAQRVLALACAQVRSTQPTKEFHKS